MTTESDLPLRQEGTPSGAFSAPSQRVRSRDLETAHLESVADVDPAEIALEMSRHPAGGSSVDDPQLQQSQQPQQPQQRRTDMEHVGAGPDDTVMIDLTDERRTLVSISRHSLDNAAPASTNTAPAITSHTLTALTVTAPTSTAPTSTAPTITAPTITAPTITAPTITAPTITAPTITAPANVTQTSDTSRAVFDLDAVDPAPTRTRRIRGYERTRGERTAEAPQRSAPTFPTAKRPGQIGAVTTSSHGAIGELLSAEQVAIGNPAVLRAAHQQVGPSGSSARRQILRTSPRTERLGSRGIEAESKTSESKTSKSNRRSLIDLVGLAPVGTTNPSSSPMPTYESSNHGRSEVRIASDERLFERFINPRVAQRRASVARQSVRDGRRPYVLAGSLVILAALGVGIAFSPILSVRRVSISGAGARREALAKIANVQTGTPMLRIDVSQIQKRLASIAEVEAVKVERDWPRSVEIRVVVRQPIVAMRSGEVVALVAKDGTVLREMSAKQNLAGSPTLWNDAEGVSVPLLIASPGANVGEKATSAAGQMVTVLGNLDPLLRPRVQYVERIDNDLVLTISRNPSKGSSKPSGVRVNLGDEAELELKAQALKAVIASEAFADATAVDLSVPDVPVIRSSPS
jgi:hypothetical protein